jgi:hypothetical protein
MDQQKKRTKRKGKKKYIIVPKKKIYTVPQNYEYNMTGGYIYALLGIGAFLGASLGGYTLYNMYNNSKDSDTNDIFSGFKFIPKKTATTSDDTIIPSGNISLENAPSEQKKFTNILKQTEDLYNNTDRAQEADPPPYSASVAATAVAPAAATPPAATPPAAADTPATPPAAAAAAPAAPTREPISAMELAIKRTMSAMRLPRNSAPATPPPAATPPPPATRETISAAERAMGVTMLPRNRAP